MGWPLPIKAANTLLDGPQAYVTNQAQDAVLVRSARVLEPTMPKNGLRHRRVRFAAIGKHQDWVWPVLKPVKDSFLRKHAMQKREVSFTPLTAVGLARGGADDAPFKRDADGGKQLADHFLHRPIVKDAPMRTMFEHRESWLEPKPQDHSTIRASRREFTSGDDSIDRANPPANRNLEPRSTAQHGLLVHNIRAGHADLEAEGSIDALPPFKAEHDKIATQRVDRQKERGHGC
jgi:hypothetical protein